LLLTCPLAIMSLRHYFQVQSEVGTNRHYLTRTLIRNCWCWTARCVASRRPVFHQVHERVFPVGHDIRTDLEPSRRVATDVRECLGRAKPSAAAWLFLVTLIADVGWFPPPERSTRSRSPPWMTHSAARWAIYPGRDVGTCERQPVLLHQASMARDVHRVQIAFVQHGFGDPLGVFVRAMPAGLMTMSPGVRPLLFDPST
jgi:hypothetical protein